MIRDSRLAIQGERIGPGGPAGLQNRDGGASGVPGGFDSHTLPPLADGPTDRRTDGLTVTVRPAVRPSARLLLFLTLLAGSPLAAQDTTRVIPPSDSRGRQAQDTSVYRRAPVSPMGGFFRSLLVPGWAQAKLGRRLSAGLFLAWEGVTLGMSIKADRELQYLKQRGDTDEAIDGKRQEREDWLILLGFNHLFAALEAYVASHLYDFPRDLEIRAAPTGLGAVVSVPFRLR